MSGIVGIWNFDGAPVDRALLSDLASVQSHRNQDGTGAWIDGDIGLLFQNLWVTPESVGEIQPLVHASESVVLFDGRLDNREELLPNLTLQSRSGRDRPGRRRLQEIRTTFNRRFGKYEHRV